jgi:beta-barrel assembly-enhancing protease
MLGRVSARQADLLGAQIMARAGYDPREMANMFKTIQEQGGRSGPEWLSSHPDPGNRYNAIVKEASTLRVQGNANTGQFASIKTRLAGMSPAYTAEQIAKGQARTGRAPVGTSGRTATVNVQAPSGSYRTHQPADFLRVSVPSNWDEVENGNGGVTYAPNGGFFEGDNGTAFTHGVQIGVAQGGSGNLQRDTQQMINNFARSNPELQAAGNARRENIGGRNGLTTPLRNVSEVTGQAEYVTLSTTQLRDGSLLFIIGVAPQPLANQYETAFRRVRQSVQIAD